MFKVTTLAYCAHCTLSYMLKDKVLTFPNCWPHHLFTLTAGRTASTEEGSSLLSSGLCTFFLCLYSSLEEINTLRQRSQLKGFSPVWVLWWICMPLNWENVLEHWGQLKGFSPVWTHFICLFMLANELKDIEHWEQLKGFSPVWVLKWYFKDNGLA